MKDIEYLHRACRNGHGCPECRRDYLRMNGLGCVAVCPRCDSRWATYRDLFRSVADDRLWAPHAWDTWLRAHPDYEP